MRAEPTEGTNNAEGRITAGCKWGEAEEGHEACEEHKGEC